MKASFPSQKADKFLLRLPDGVRDQIAVAAVANNRTMTKEMVLRLQKSFEPNNNELPDVVREAVNAEAARGKCTPEQALINLVLAGQSNGGQVLSIRIAPGMPLKEVRDALSAMVDVVPNASNVVIERE